MLNARPNHIKRNAIENNIIKNIRNLSRLKEKINNAITEKINRGISYLNQIMKFIMNQYGWETLRITIILSMKVTVIERKRYQLKNISAKLDHI